MRTLGEIQDAVVRLGDDEKKALALWLSSQMAPDFPVQEEERLLRSLDEALRAVDAGQGLSEDAARQRVASWTGK